MESFPVGFFVRGPNTSVKVENRLADYTVDFFYSGEAFVESVNLFTLSLSEK